MENRLVGADDDVYDIADFIELCKDGTFIDYDGFGNYVHENEVHYEAGRVIPSEIKKGKVDCRFAQVVWYNR